MVCIAPKIISVEALSGSRISVCYETGEERILDVSSAVRGSFMGELADEGYFKQVRVIDGGLSVGWPHGQDIDPCWIYEDGIPA